MKREPFVNFSGTAAPLPLKNINTDAIIPATYLRTADADLAAGLFALWRYDETGKEKADFILNRPGFRHATILFGGENFGCGSSREAAAWALVRFGIKAVFAPSFADIFYENAFRNGLLAGVIEKNTLDHVLALIGNDATNANVAVNLHDHTFTAKDSRAMTFLIPDFRREALLRGDDDIATTLRFSENIDAFMVQDQKNRSWIYETDLALQKGQSR